MERNSDNKEIDSSDVRSPRTVVHNISINVTTADSPVGVRRRIHLRSLSDVTPSARSPVARARSHSERPRASLAPSPAPSPRRPPGSPAALTAPQPRAVRSERSSPDASLHALADIDRPRPEQDPWRKMSEADLINGPRRPRAAARASLDAPSSADPWVREGGGVRRGRLERAAAVACEACGAASCECWRCTCSARPSPARPRPPRAHSDDEERPRRLYKSSSQRAVGGAITAGLGAGADGARADPLLETTC